MVLATTSRLLIEVVRCGLVVRDPGGYELNRDHLAYQALAVLLGARDELQRRVEHDVAGWETRPLSVVLFGSAARQHDTDDPLIAPLLREGIRLVGAKLGDLALSGLAAARRPGGDALHSVAPRVPT
jgi:hypothetical protein